MTLQTATAQLLVDLDDTLNFSTDITAYWYRDGGFDLPAVGRNEELGLAEMGKATFLLDNRDGRFSPANAGSAYYDNFHPYKHIKATITYNSVTYNTFYGVITRIDVDPNARSGGIVHVQATDEMYTLSRTDIRCPLMQGYTGPIINRLIDRAEVGELVTNPTGETDLGSWSVGASTITRMTTDNLEGPGSIKLVSGAANDGVQYTLSTDVHNQKVLAAVYVRAETDSEIGKTVRLRLHDSVGIVATGSYVALTDRWQRLTLSGTYNNASVTQYISTQCAASATSVRIGALHCTKFVAAIGRSVDDGENILDAFTWHRGAALSAIQKVTANELNGLFYMDGAGNAVFEDKDHRWLPPHDSSLATFDERGIPTYSENAEDRIREVVLDYPRYITGTADSVLWKLDRVPVAVEASASVTFEVDYDGGLAKAVTTPVATTDYLASRNADGSGANETGNLLVTVFHDYGAGAEVTLENQQTYPIYLTFLQIRGTPIRVASDRTPARVTASAGPAIAATLSHNFDLLGSTPAVESWAQYLADRYDGQQSRLTLALSAAWPKADDTSSDMTQILARAPSDRVTFTNNNLAIGTQVNGDFYIDKIDRRISGESIDCVWNLSPVDADYFIIDTDVIDGTAVIAP